MALTAFPISRMLDYTRLVTTSRTSSTLDANGEKIAFVVMLPASGNISTVSVSISTNGTDGDYTCQIQTVDTTTGLPTGSAYGGGSTETLSITTDGFKTWTLATPATATAGDFVAVVFTQAGAGNNAFARQLNATAQFFPYILTDLSAGSWSTPIDEATLLISLGYSDGTFPYIPGCFGTNAGAATKTYKSTDNPDEYGLTFTPPGPLQLDGVWWWGTVPTGQNVVIKLCSSLTTTTEVATLATLPGDAINDGETGWRSIKFATPVTLTAGTVYIIGLSPSSTANMTLGAWTFASNAAMEASPLGKGAYLATRNDTGKTWTADSTTQPMLIPIFSQVDDGAPPPTYILGV